MNGLDLESLLRLIRADLGAWASLGLIASILAVMTWTSWGSRRALRKCLVLSIAAHVGLIVYGSRSPIVLKALRLGPAAEKKADRPDRPVRVTPWVADKPATGPDGRPTRVVDAWDLDRGSLAMADPSRLNSSSTPSPPPVVDRAEPSPIASESVAPEVQAPSPPPVASLPAPGTSSPDVPPSVASGDPSEVAPPVSNLDSAPNLGSIPPTGRVRPEVPAPDVSRPAPARIRPTSPTLPQAPSVEPPASRAAPSGRLTEPMPPMTRSPSGDVPLTTPDELDSGPPTPVASPSPAPGLPDPVISRAPRSVVAGSNLAAPSRLADGSAPTSLARVTPTAPSSVSTLSRPTTRRTLAEVPSVYRSRLDPNRTVVAQRAGASVASEQAVERALDWLARHQDADGSWDGGTARYRDGSVPPNDDSFTLHCPAGEVCFGECFYWEADTALTGLSLLAYLGAGYTHLDGKYFQVVGKGLEFLVKIQKPDGDLRGPSVVVGMYCHSMATLALAEAYALTGDARLKPSLEKAVNFLVKSRSKDGLAWRYEPGAPVGDTSILGWAVMALKSAKTAGIPIPPPTQAGILQWLKKVSAGKEGGLARYQPTDKVLPTMTAEAWACRQFLEVGGPGPTSDEAAAFLLQNKSDRGEFNIYYLYYGTLAMYQHGGSAWSTWNGRVRDDIVRRQRTKGHMAGSWDPDDSPYGTHGGRIYGTALATLTLEVYYRFLRLYDPNAPTPIAPAPAGDGGARRAGFNLDPSGR